MKLFGWGKNQDPPPLQTSAKEFQKPGKVPFWFLSSDATRRTHSPETADQCQSERGGWFESSLRQKTDVGLRRTSKDFSGHHVEDSGLGDQYLSRGANDLSSEWENRLQETIQFVFSHEQEGLLAIGTFALDQLAGVRNSLDGRPRKPSQSNLRRNSVPNVPLVDREVRSSEDEAESCQSASRDPLPACASSTTITRKDLPVFGDHDASFGVVSVGHAARNYLQLFSSVGRDIPAVLLQAAIDPRKEVETQLESRPGKQLHVGTSPTDDHSDEETFSQRRCGVVLSRWRTSKSDIKSKRKKPPEKQLDNVDRELHMRADGKNRASRGIKRLWRSGCSLCVTAKVAPVKKQNFLTAEREFRKQGPPCIANVDSGATSTSSTPNSSPLPHCPQKEPNQAADLTGELSRRRGASLGKGWACNHNGKWIRTDSEFVVLEM
ncbi:uncharacterized protein [Physcomitrium patens]|uniref:Uncharacterized protein n=1 Tax=Physcomitrium patens TaxID=3218 RepID=A0A2K1KWA6_PHYPA|nr:uncharacterized protein LOC112279600 [Physcomitrium patens]XP_024369978.1 uncharacterized protein LOC112279600 [Physcomitrium patens]XP_024369979.1 uncharacterized protein LOC112279600 [Physcomitrium patens]PNR58036.1 hypothetical protein PHYPA_005031 [Physcomitrium patens]|eukprot:XP_024369977.1 uncharacterized protein LOC112279600 [Physcomitrella patens]